jgi:hypothetical protein
MAKIEFGRWPIGVIGDIATHNLLFFEVIMGRYYENLMVALQVRTVHLTIQAFLVVLLLVKRIMMMQKIWHFRLVLACDRRCKILQTGRLCGVAHSRRR